MNEVVPISVYSYCTCAMYLLFAGSGARRGGWAPVWVQGPVAEDRTDETGMERSMCLCLKDYTSLIRVTKVDTVCKQCLRITSTDY